MQAVVYTAARSFDVREIATPEPGPGEVLLRCLQMGFCGTDLHLHAGGFGARFPLTPGHEMVGVVERLGPGVAGLVEREQVSVNPNIYCGRCDYCRSGRLGQCDSMLAYGVNLPGFFAQYAVVAADQVFSTEGLDLDTAVFTEPASCAMHGLETLDPRPGSTALILGAGPTGLLLAQMLAGGGVAHVTVADPSAAKLTCAAGLGLDATVAIGLISPDSQDAVTALLRDASPGGAGYDVVVEATGSATVGSVAVGAVGVPLTRSGGTVLIYGVAREDATIAIRPYDVFRREITIKGSFAEMTSFGAAIRMLRSGRVRTDGIISHRFALADFGQAVETAMGDPAAHKIVLVP